LNEEDLTKLANREIQLDNHLRNVKHLDELDKVTNNYLNIGISLDESFLTTLRSHIINDNKTSSQTER